MALMNWAIDVPQKLSQSDAKLFFLEENERGANHEKKLYYKNIGTDCHLKFGGMKQEFRVIVDH